jgi:RNA polymerase sigma-70 factor (ECF subfamily)
VQAVRFIHDPGTPGDSDGDVMDDDSEGLEAFCHGVYPSLVGTLTLYVGDRETARELAQEALAKVCQHWSRVRLMDAPQAWTHRVALNLANSWFRRRSAERAATRRLEAFPETKESWQPDDVLAVRAAVAALPRRQREALVLRYYRDLTVEQSALEMGCRSGTVKALTSQAIASLRRSGLVDARLEGSGPGDAGLVSADISVDISVEKEAPDVS